MHCYNIHRDCLHSPHTILEVGKSQLQLVIQLGAKRKVVDKHQTVGKKRERGACEHLVKKPSQVEPGSSWARGGEEERWGL